MIAALSKNLIGLAGLAFLCLNAAAAAEQPGLVFKELSEDTKLTTASGATFTAARG